MIAYVKNPKDLPKKGTRSNEWTYKVAEHKVNVQISVVFLYDSKAQLEIEIKNNNTIVSKTWNSNKFDKNMCKTWNLENWKL